MRTQPTNSTLVRCLLLLLLTSYCNQGRTLCASPAAGNATRTMSPLACSSSSPRQRRMTGARRGQRAGSTTGISDSYSSPRRTPTIQAPRPCLCLLHECCKARHLTGVDSALHAFTQLQYQTTSLTSCTETRCKSADDHSPIVRFRRVRACTGGQTKGRTIKGCMQVPSARVEFSPA